jgi:hypothetical protein
MVAAAEQVNFGVDKEKLRASSPGTAITSYNVNWDALMNGDTSATPEGIIGPEIATIVPLVNGSEVVAVVALANKGNSFSIAELGNKQKTTELDMVQKVAQGNVRILEVPNLQATIYAVAVDTTTMYFTSYRNNSIRQPVSGAALMRILASDAAEFQKKFGDQVKKGKLVK